MSQIGRTGIIDHEMTIDGELGVITNEKQAPADVCLLVDSPYRILRVSFKMKVKFIIERSMNFDKNEEFSKFL